MQSIEIFPILVPSNLGNLQTVNFYLVRTEGKLLLIDAGVNNEDCWQQLNKTLALASATLEDLEAILLTHNHSDHIGLVNRIRSKTSVDVYAPKKSIPRIQRDRSFFEKRYVFYKQLFQQMGCEDDANERMEQLKLATFEQTEPSIIGPLTPFQLGDTLFGFDIIDVPGHSPDHVLFYHTESKHMFVGDHFMVHSPSNAIFDIENDGTIFRSLIQYEQSLQKVLSLNMGTAYAGHGEIMDAPRHVVFNKLNRIENKAKRILDILTEPKTAATIAKQLYKERYYHQQLFSLIMSEVYGHLDRLTALKFVERKQKNGIYFFQKKSCGGI